MADSPGPGPGPAPAPAPAPAMAPVTSLETELTCSICTDLLYRPLTLLDCLHTFCAACAKEWFRFQAARAESAPGPPPPPDAAVFTCPSCRERVRGTRHDARVESLLDMFLALNPARARAEDDRRAMDARYVRGEDVLPRLRWDGRTEEEVSMDERERRLIEEVQRVSLREATEAAVARAGGNAGDGGGSGGSGGGGGGGGVQGRRGRRSREGSRAREERDEDDGRRTRRTRRGSESRQRERTDGAAEPRQVEHQSSLRNLMISSEGIGMDPRDVEREIEEFAKQIQEEGLLDGLDLDNLDLEHNDELSRKITEAYRRRQRERRRDGGRRSNASAYSQRSDASARPASRARDASRPASRHTAHSRAPSAGSAEERGRYPPSSSALLEVQQPARRRARTSSGGRSATVPVVPTQADARAGARSQTDLAARSNAAGSHHSRRPSLGVDARSSSSPTTVAAPASRGGDSSANRTLPFSARAAAGLGIAQAPPEAQADSAGSRLRSARPASLNVREDSPTLGFASAPASPGLPASPPLASPRRAPSPRYREPLLNCSTCSREHIQYDLHFNCSVCHDGEWNICLDCWRRRKGCLHWFGFGPAARARWEKRNLAGPPIPPPHTLTARRYLPPRTSSHSGGGGGGGGSGVLTTTENPLDRLQTGAFCSRCGAWANDCYWRCDACNEGEWGFCSACVDRGMSCTHPLLALAHDGPPPLSPPSPSQSPSTPSAAAPSSGLGLLSHLRPLVPPPSRPCSVCRMPIPLSEPRYLCYVCPPSPSPSLSPSPPPPQTTTTTIPHPDSGRSHEAAGEGGFETRRVQEGSEDGAKEGEGGGGGYTLCSGCYISMADSAPAPVSDEPGGAAVAVSRENGPAGWRRCPRGGHRMVVVGFVSVSAPSGSGYGSGFESGSASGPGDAPPHRAVSHHPNVPRRVVLRDLVGGRRLRFEEWNGGAAPGPGRVRARVCSWREQGTGRKVARLFSRAVGDSTRSAAAAAAAAASASASAVAVAGFSDGGNVGGGGGGGSGGGRQLVEGFPPDGGTGMRAAAGWGWIPAAGVEDELMFPKGAEIVEVEDVNGEWFHGFYMGAQGLFPAPYVRLMGSS